MSGKKRTERPNRHWLEVSLPKLQGDRALHALAEMSMQDWCSSFGGVPSDPAELLTLRCSLEPAASKLLSTLMAMPDADRCAVAHRLWPKPLTAA